MKPHTSALIIQNGMSHADAEYFLLLFMNNKPRMRKKVTH